MIARVQPYVEKSTNWIEIFNEMMIMLVGYFAMAYVGIIVDNPPQAELCGTFMRWVIRIHIGVNIILILWEQTKAIKRYFYLLRIKAINAKIRIAKFRFDRRQRKLRRMLLKGLRIDLDEIEIEEIPWRILKEDAMVHDF